MAQVLLVVPESILRPEPPPHLELLSYSVAQATGVEDAVRKASDAQLILLDARGDLPAARNLCMVLSGQLSNQPILLLVDLGGTQLIQRDWGFDDFVVEQAPPGELDARIRFLLASRATSTSIVQGPVTIDEAAYTVTVNHRPLDLTYTEFELLKFLVTHPGRVLTREHLLSEVWGYDYYGGTRTVDVHIRRLRAKLGPEYDSCITTVRNVGYRFSAT